MSTAKLSKSSKTSQVRVLLNTTRRYYHANKHPHIENNRIPTKLEETKSMTNILIPCTKPSSDIFAIKNKMDVMIRDINCINSTNAVFRSCICQMTHNGKLTVQDDKNNVFVYIVDDCGVIEADTSFMLTATPISSQQDATQQEIICWANNEEEFLTWMLHIDKAILNRLDGKNDQMTCTRGKLDVLEVSPNELRYGDTNMKDSIKHIDMKSARCYHCFFYLNAFRIRNFEGPQTTCLRIKEITLEKDNFPPLSFMLETRGRRFICKAPTPYKLNQWYSTILTAVNSEKVNSDVFSLSQGNTNPFTIGNGMAPIADWLYIGLIPTEMNIMNVFFNPKNRYLECYNNKQLINRFYVYRCTLPAPNVDLKCDFVLTCARLVPDASSTNSFHRCQEVIVFGSCIRKSIDCTLPTQNSLVKWLDLLGAPSNNLFILLRFIALEIEKRWKSSCGMQKSQTDGQSNVSFDEISNLLTLDYSSLCTQLATVPLHRLESLIECTLKMFTEPIIPFRFQQDILHIHSSLETNNDVSFDETDSKIFLSEIEAVLDKCPNTSRKILRLFSIHIFRLSSIFNKFKDREERGLHGDWSHSSKSMSATKVGSVVWQRLTPNMFRFSEQNMPVEPQSMIKSVVKRLITYQTTWIAKNEGKFDYYDLCQAGDDVLLDILL